MIRTFHFQQEIIECVVYDPQGDLVLARSRAFPRARCHQRDAKLSLFSAGDRVTRIPRVARRMRP